MKSFDLFLNQPEAQARYNVCKQCEHFMLTTQCAKCMCFMKVKVKLRNAKCPENNWLKEPDLAVN